MADDFTQLGSLALTDKIDQEVLTVGLNLVKRQRVEIAGAAAAEIARILNSTPTGTEYGVAVRQVGPVAVTGTFYQATQPVSGTVSVGNFPATQAVSGSVSVSNFPASQAVTGTFWPTTQPVSGTVSVGNFPATQAVSGSVSVSNFPATQAVTGTFWQATQPISGSVSVSNFPASQAVTGTFWQTTQPVSLATLPALAAGANAIGSVTVTPPARTPIVLSASGVTSVTTAALMTLNIYRAGTITSATNYTVATGKTFRIQSIQFGIRFITPSTTVTFASNTFTLRYVTTGTVTTAGNILLQDSKMAASNTPTPNSDLPIPEGLDIPAGYNFGVTQLASAATLAVDVIVVGYEY